MPSTKVIAQDRPPCTASVGQAAEIASPTGRPMRIQVFSDAHGSPLEDVVRPMDGVDAVVCAGDVTRGPRSTLEALRRTFPGTTPIICVLGDEEYRDQAYEDVLRSARDTAASLGVTLLQDSTAVIAGVRFMGGTLWTDFRLGGEDADLVNAAIDAADARMLDARRMRWGRAQPFSAYSTLWPHWYTRRWTEREIRLPFPGPTIVVTHHAPSARSLPLGFQHDPLAPAYASPADASVAGCGAALWIHGHVHAPADYAIGDTRVLANPCGADRLGTGFGPGLVVEVPLPRQ